MTPKLFFSTFSTILLITTLTSCTNALITPSPLPHHHDIPYATTAMPPTPSQSQGNADCLAIIYDMADCLSFLAVGSAEQNPTASCCRGFKSVMDVNVECICEAVNGGHEMGLEINMTKAVGLPSACGFPLPPLHCDAISPMSSPTYSPMQAPSATQSPSGSQPPSSAPQSPSGSQPPSSATESPSGSQPPSSATQSPSGSQPPSATQSPSGSQPPVTPASETPAEAPTSGSKIISIPVFFILFILSSSIVLRY